jgi:hypothetical protein
MAYSLECSRGPRRLPEKEMWLWCVHGVGVGFIQLGATVATDVMHRRTEV